MRRFYLIRHGETDWNRKLRRLQGHSDIPLNEVGIEQAKRLSPLLRPLQIDRWISSDLARASETARLLSQQPIETATELREIKLGEAEGKTLEEVDLIYGAHLRKNWSSFDRQYEDLCFPHGESRKEVLLRAQSCIHSFLDLYPADTLAFVTHGYLIRSLVFAKSQIEHDFLVPNCAVVPFVRNQNRTLTYHGPQDPQSLIGASQN